MDAQALGRYLRESREAKELTLEDAERALKIRRRILESFELGEFNLADASTVQIRGFVRNYARFLGLDEDRVVAYFESARHEAEMPRRRAGKRTTQTMAPVAAKRVTDTNPSLPAVPIVNFEPQARRNSLLNTLVMLLVAAASVAVIVFVVVQLVGRTQQEPGLEAPEDILGQLPPTPTDTPLPTLTPAPTLTPLPGFQQNYSGQGVLVTIGFSQRTWLRVSSDGIERFAGIVLPDAPPQEYPASDNVTVTASNAEALVVTWNGQAQSSYGERGQRVDIVFREENVDITTGPGFDPTSEFTPTALPTSAIDVGGTVSALTPSNTPGPSPTPTQTPSITPTPSNTPTPSDTPTVTPTASNTPPPTNTPTVTPTPTNTLTPTATAILPPRVTQEGLPPTKEIE